MQHACRTNALLQVRQYLCAPDSSASNREVFAWILRCLLEGGAAGGGIPHLQRMAGFLEENGVSKQDIESSSAALKVANESGMYWVMHAWYRY